MMQYDMNSTVTVDSKDGRGDQEPRHAGRPLEASKCKDSPQNF